MLLEGVKRSASIFLVVLLLYSGVGFIIAFEVGIAKLHQAVEEMLEKEEHGSLVTLTFHHAANIHFKDGGKEIYLQGQMYDIVSREQQGDSLTFLCYHDVEESKQMQAFEQQVQDFSDNDASSEKEGKQSTQKAKQEYVKTILAFSLSSATFTQTDYELINVTLIGMHTSVPYPPPKRT